MQVDINSVEEIRLNINQNVPNTLRDISYKVSEIKANLPRSVANKKMNDYKLYNLNRKVKNINDDVNEITSVLYKAVSGMQDAENKIAKMLSSISIKTVGTSISTNNKISSWESVLADKSRVKQWFEDTGADIIKRFTTKTSRIPDIFQKLKDTGAKIKNAFKREEKTDVLSVADESFDEGIFEKTTLLSEDGARIIFAKKEKLDDGSIEYYDESGNLIKKVLSDGSCEIYAMAFSNHKFYNAEGKLYGGSVSFSSIGGPSNVDKLRIYPDGKKEYFVGSHLRRKEEPDGSYIEYFTSGKWGALKEGELRIEKIYHADGTYEIYKNTTEQLIDKKYQADGSYVAFDMDGNVKEEMLPDKTVLKYFPNGSKQVRFEEKLNGELIEYNEEGKIVEKEYNGGFLKGGITEKYLDGKLIKKINGDKEEYFDESGKVRVVYDGKQYTVYNADGTNDIYDKNQVVESSIGTRIPDKEKHLISFELKDGTKRIISTNGEVIYDKKTNSYSTTVGNQKVSDFGYLSEKNKISTQLNELGCSVDSSKLPSTAYVYANYDNDKVSSVDLYESGMTSKYDWCTFVKKITVYPNGKVETHEIYCELNDAAKGGYDPKEVFNNPDAYISKIIKRN